MSKVRLVVVLVILALVAVGCAKTAENVLENAIEKQLEDEGGGDVNVDLNEDGGSVSIETDEGSVEFGNTEIPADFLLPIPNYEEVGGVITTTGEFASTQVILSFDPDDFDEVAALYEDFFNDQGWEVSRTESSGEGVRFVSITGSSDELAASVFITYSDGDDVASLTAQYGNN